MSFLINSVDQDVVRTTKADKSIYLAGPISNKGDVNSWRKEATKILDELGFDGIIYMPELDGGGPADDFNYQTNWEEEALNQAKVVVFWIPCHATNCVCLQFGWCLGSGKETVYGRKCNAYKVKCLDVLYQRVYEDNPIFNNLAELLKASLENF